MGAHLANAKLNEEQRDTAMAVVRDVETRVRALRCPVADRRDATKGYVAENLEVVDAACDRLRHEHWGHP
jgi:hypothetical protein